MGLGWGWTVSGSLLSSPCPSHAVYLEWIHCHWAISPQLRNLDSFISCFLHLRNSLYFVFKFSQIHERLNGVLYNLLSHIPVMMRLAYLCLMLIFGFFGYCILASNVFDL